MATPEDEPGLTAAEVASLLGIKRQTVYAYVSRGVLHRRLSLDGRTSLFDRGEVEELRLGRRPEQEGEMRTILATGLTRVADEGLWIRGRDVVQLVEAGAGFLDLAELVWDGAADTPADGELIGWPPIERTSDRLPPTLDTSDPASLLDQLQVLVAVAASADPMRHDLSPRSVRAAGRRMITAMASGLRHRSAGAAAPDPSLPVATALPAVLWYQLSPAEPDPPKLLALDAALALLVDHGLATSTLAARVAASVRADPYAVVTSGLGTLGGPLHGRASSVVYDLYRVAERDGPAAAVGQLQRRGLRVPGFGHTVYRSQDPRYGALMSRVVAGWADDPRLGVVFGVRDVVAQRNAAVPNVDLALGALTFLADMPPNAGEAIFAVARTAGWLAHAIEEYDEKPFRFRTRAHYVGPHPGQADAHTASASPALRGGDDGT
ncbi:MAG: citrate/2-methylcitrate synthase [Actinomycetota bacterium]